MLSVELFTISPTVFFHQLLHISNMLLASLLIQKQLFRSITECDSTNDLGSLNNV